MVRTLSRELYPPNLVENEIIFTLKEFAENTSGLFGIACKFEYEEGLAVSNNFAATQIYYIVREAVNNAVKHGKAGSIRIRLTSDIESVNLDVEDDGEGLPEGFDAKSGLGLRTMAYRIKSLHGTFRIQGGASGGTAVHCAFPFYQTGQEA
jgi:two-component system sensor kinase FixL